LVVLILLTTLPSLVAAYLVSKNGDRPTGAVIATASLVALLMIAASRIERSRVARELASKHGQTEAILDASADAYVGMDAAGYITAWSGQAEQTFGWSADEVIGRTVAEVIVPPNMRVGHDEGLRRYLETGYGPVLGTRIELEALHRNGHTFPIELAVWEAQGEDGPVFVSFIHDITDRRHKESELAAARDAAMEASLLKSEFVANMSHEIRTPMNGMIGMTDLMSRTQLTLDQREYINTIRLSADALLNVINDILDFSKIEAGKLQLDQRDFELRTVVDDVGALLAGTAQSKGVELVTNVDAPIPANLHGDAGRLRQVLLNVAGNAVKFTETGEVLIEVSMEDAPAGAALLRFRVRDTGPGIPLEQQELLFESFSQGDASTTRRYGGTGLGLAISKRLVELMDGEIELESEVGKGTTVCFTARFRSLPDVRPPVYADVETMRDLPVLIVDDNATNRTILEHTIAGWEMVPVAAASADEAITALETRNSTGDPFRIALLDLHMPNVDGAQLARVMAADPRFSRIHRVLLTSTGDRGGLRDGEIDRHLTKPIRQSALFLCLGELLGAVESSPALAGTSETPSAMAREGLRILLAEDNPVNQLVARRMLETLGYDVGVVSNGAEAVNAIAHSHYAAILMDCQMPLMDGYEATAKIREAESGNLRTPVIAMTANAMDGDAERCLASGMDDYLAKPVSIEQLGRTLARWIDSAKNGAAVAPISVVDEKQTLDLTVVDAIQNMTRHNKDAFEEMVRTFNDTFAENIASLRAAVGRPDMAAIENLAHSMKGSAGAFGAEILAAQATDLLETAKGAHPSVDELSQLVSNMSDEFDRARSLLLTRL